MRGAAGSQTGHPVHQSQAWVPVMNVRPLHDRVVVQRLESAQQSGAIVIPDSAKEKPQHGKVVSAGLGKSGENGKRVPLDVKAGDTILFGKYSGQEIKLDGVEYEDLVRAGVIDPTKVVRSALQNAASVAGLLLTTEAVISALPEGPTAARRSP